MSISCRISFLRAAPSGQVHSDIVDLYNVETGIWSTSQLSSPRWPLSIASFESAAMFAGGGVQNSGIEGLL